MSEHVQKVNEDNFQEVVLQSEVPVLVDFWAEWCGPCRALAPIVEAVAEQYASAARVVKLSVDDNPSVVQRYRVQAIPTLILFQDGEEKERIIGAVSKEAIARAIEARVAAVPNSETENQGNTLEAPDAKLIQFR
jgi:thioredoxin 1